MTEHFSRSEAVFLGIVETQKRRSSDLEIWWHKALGYIREISGGKPYEPWNDYTTDTSFRVVENLKGPNSQVKIVGSQRSSCQFGFEVGQRYIVFASRVQPKRFLETDSCSLTTKEADSQDFLAQLRKLREKIHDSK
jgi:hypothetical protein